MHLSFLSSRIYNPSRSSRVFFRPFSVPLIFSPGYALNSPIESANFRSRVKLTTPSDRYSYCVDWHGLDAIFWLLAQRQ